MPDRKGRKLTLADLSILIAVLALAMASLRLTLAAFPPGWFRNRRTVPGALGAVSLYFEMALAHGVPLLFLASLAVVALSLLPPRPPLRRLARRSGFALCLSLVVASLGTAGFLGSAYYLHGDPYPIALLNVVAYGVVFNAGWMALGSWLVLALGGRLGPGPSWLDRIGCVAASIWFLLFVASCAAFVLGHAGVL